MLLDVVVLGINLLGVTLLENVFLDIIRRASGDDQRAMRILLGCAALLLVLAPAGATLKRWHFHQRYTGAHVLSRPLAGCLFNPVFYFCLVVVIYAAVMAFVMQELFGRREPSGIVFVPMLLGGLGLIGAHTWLVYRYFSPPKAAPASAFMRGPASELLGDAFLFANMLIFQLFWNLMSFAGLGAPSGAVDFVLRLGVLCFLALLIYFPPRMFYLAEDADQPRTWLMIFIANAPVMGRVLLGTG